MGLYNSLSSTYGFKVDLDHRQDRVSGEMTTRKMTEEEIEKYSNVGTYKKPSMVAVNELARKDIDMKAKINKERLLEICNENGFNFKAYNMAAMEVGVETSSVSCYVSNNKLKNKELINKKETPPVEETKSNTKVVTKYTEISSVIDEDLEIISKIKSIIEENKTMKHSMIKIKLALEDILKSIA